ncbi:MAG: hypothetical protein ACRDCE_17325 [Cetobacterium sp.]|uniref:hypothetical protein n=1 Tax=Cetobacterium sp. TaxID=2071632 RepID=UPI003EE7E7A7
MREEFFKKFVNASGVRRWCQKNRIAVLTIHEKTLNMTLSNTERAMVFNEYAKYVDRANDNYHVTINDKGVDVMIEMLDEWKERYNEILRDQ